MATASETPKLQIHIEYVDDKAKRQTEAFYRSEERKAEAHNAKKKRGDELLAAQTAAIQTKTAAQTAAKLEQQNALSLNKQKLAWEKYMTDRALREQKMLDRSAAANTSWSKRVATGVESLAIAVKGLAIAWVSAQVGSMIKSSIEIAGGMREIADGIGVTTQEYFALSSAMRDAGASAEKLDPIFTRLNEITSGGATDAQSAILQKLGISDGTLVTSIDLLDRLIKGFNSGAVSANDLGEIVGKRVVPSFRRLAAEITSVNEANAKYQFPLTEAEVKRLDQITAAWQRAKLASTLYFGGIFADIAAWQERVARHMLDIDGIQHTFGKLETLELRFGGRDFIPAAFRRKAPQYVGQTVGPPVAPSSPRGGAESSSPYISPIYGANVPPIRIEDIERLRPKLAEIKTEWAEIDAAAAEYGVQVLPDIVQKTMSLEDRMKQIAQSNAWQVGIAGAQAMNSVLALQAQLLQNQITALDAVSARERERWQERSEQMRAAGLENSAMYRNELRQFNEAEKRREAQATSLKSKAFEQDKIGRSVSTVMSTSQAVMNAWATLPWPFSTIIAGLALAQGAVQVATIQAQQNPYHFREGGWVRGPASDNNRVNATGGEFMVERNTAARNSSALEYMRGGGTLAPGGGDIHLHIAGNVIQSNDWIEEEVIPRIRKAQRRGVVVFN